MITLVIYDISNDRDREKLADLLFNFGLTRIQYSAFKGELNPHDRSLLLDRVKKYAKGERDSIYIVPLCDRCFRLCSIVSLKEIDEGEVRIV